jgi:hypothetical protein
MIYLVKEVCVCVCDSRELVRVPASKRETTVCLERES